MLLAKVKKYFTCTRKQDCYANPFQNFPLDCYKSPCTCSSFLPYVVLSDCYPPQSQWQLFPSPKQYKMQQRFQNGCSYFFSNQRNDKTHWPKSIIVPNTDVDNSVNKSILTDVSRKSIIVSNILNGQSSPQILDCRNHNTDWLN